MAESLYWNPVLETLPRADLKKLQLAKFKRQLNRVYAQSTFYKKKLDEAGVHPDQIQALDDIRRIPTTTKEELQQLQSDVENFPYGPCLAVPTDRVATYHQTSGTTGKPIRQADSREDWEWWIECWATFLWAQGFRPHDRVFIPFSYGVFVAFWAGHYACEKIGCEVVAGGGLSTQDRLLKLQELEATAVLCTPTYGLHMAEVAEEMDLKLADFKVNKMVCAGEPGASIPATKNRLESYWGARVFDHAGATEGGAWGFGCLDEPSDLHINEAFFMVETLNPDTGRPVDSGEEGELIITPLDRQAQPYLRFSLKDMALFSDEPCKCGRTFARLRGGVLGRRDDLTKVRGVLFSPTSVEAVVRAVDQLGDEFQVVVEKKGNLDEITLKAELKNGAHATIELETHLLQELRLSSGLRFNLELVPLGTLPRFEVKAKRFQDLRTHA